MTSNTAITRLRQAASLIEDVIALDPESPASRDSYLDIADHITSIASHLAPIDPFNSIRYLERLADAKGLVAQHSAAINSYEQALKLIRQAEDSPTEHQAILLSKLGRFYTERRDLEKGRTFLTRALRILEAVGSTNTVPYTLTLKRLGYNHRFAGNLDEADMFLSESLQICSTEFGNLHIATSDTSNSLGLLRLSQGRLAEAELYLQDSISTYRSLAINKLPIPLNNLSIVKRLLGKFAEAEAAAKESLAIREELFGPGHLVTAKTFGNLAQVQRELGKLDAATRSTEASLRISELSLESNPTMFAPSIRTLGTIQLAANNTILAEVTLSTALGLYRHGPKQLHLTGPLMVILAKACSRNGKVVEAQAYLAEAERVVAASYGSENFRVGIALTNRAEVERKLGNHDVATTYLDRGEVIIEKSFNHRHYEIGNARYYRGLLAEDQGDLKLAETHLLKALGIKEESYGAYSYQLIDTLSALARVQATMGDQEESRTNEERAERLLAAMEKPDFKPLPPSVLAYSQPETSRSK